MSSSSLPRKVRPTTPITPCPLPDLPSSPPIPPTQPLLRNGPLAHFSYSPASSPRVIAPPPSRTHSIRPEMSDFMDQGIEPGADFFDRDSSGEEDDDGTRDFSELEGLAFDIRDIVAGEDVYGETGSWTHEDDAEDKVWQRGRASARTSYRGSQTGDGVMHVLPPFNQLPAHEYGTGTGTGTGETGSDHCGNEEEPGQYDGEEDSGLYDGERQRLSRKGTKKAHQVSLRRLGRGKVVHNHGSAYIDTTSGELGGGEGSNDVVHTHHRRNTSDSSIRADSIINAHAITMQALESLSPTESFAPAHAPQSPGRDRRRSHSLDSPILQKSSSTRPLSDRRRKQVPTLTTDLGDPRRPKNLPSHFIMTPYPFASKKEFPKPKVRPRNHCSEYGQEDAEGDKNYMVHDQAKGKRVLGIVASDETFDLTSGSERNEDAQDTIRSRSDVPEHGRRSDEERRRGAGGSQCVVFVSLRSRRGDGGVVNRLEKIIIPRSLTTTSPSPERKGTKSRSQTLPKQGAAGKGNKQGRGTTNGTEGGMVMVDFDDEYFAVRLKAAYRSLSGGWFLRTFSARSLKYIQLGQVSVWSGENRNPSSSSSTPRLLSARGGLESGHVVGNDSASPFTEDNLLDLYKNPKAGKARYTWVHWGRRVAVSNGKMLQLNPLAPETHDGAPNTLDMEYYNDNSETEHQRHIHQHHHHHHHHHMLTTIQFTHSFSAPRIFLAVMTMPVLSVVAALLWILLGTSAWDLREASGRAERVGPGMAVGGLMLVLQMVVFAAWVAGSWLWL